MRLHKQRSEAESVGKGSGRLANWLEILRRAVARCFPAPHEQKHPWESEFAELRSQVDLLNARVRGLEERERPAIASRGEMALNLTAKSAALKLARSGQDARQIARTLGVPFGEIDLLLKVERLQKA
jgi:hypothetical protein